MHNDSEKDIRLTELQVPFMYMADVHSFSTNSLTYSKCITTKQQF